MKAMQVDEATRLQTDHGCFESYTRMPRYYDFSSTFKRMKSFRLLSEPFPE